MRSILFFTVLIIFSFASCKNSEQNNTLVKNLDSSCCTDDCFAKSKSTILTCKLTSAEMQNRKATIIESLRKQITERKELENGYAFKFNGSDKMLDELTEFIKTERECCDFFTFNLSIAGDKNEIWLSLTGPMEVKEFIKTEMDLS
ncbi:hypothetical protein BH11BAC1_BH11BAC1_17230 [soil metagenome]